MSTRTLTITDDESQFALMAIGVRLTELKKYLRSNDEYVAGLADATDELHVGYRESSERYGAGLRAEVAALETVYDKLLSRSSS